MNAFERLKEARHAGRPTGAAYVAVLFENRLDLCGDRRFGEDPAIISGIGTLSGRPVTYIAIDKGADLDSRMRNHFGCPMPEGYRKALRLMKQAEKFHRPVICLVDTLGAYCGAEAEERGQGEAIAENILEMMGLRTPVISVVIGEGGSGRPRVYAGKRRLLRHFAGGLCQHPLEGLRPRGGCRAVPAHHGGRYGRPACGRGDHSGEFCRLPADVRRHDGAAYDGS